VQNVCKRNYKTHIYTGVEVSNGRRELGSQSASRLLPGALLAVLASEIDRTIRTFFEVSTLFPLAPTKRAGRPGRSNSGTGNLRRFLPRAHKPGRDAKDAQKPRSAELSGVQNAHLHPEAVPIGLGTRAFHRALARPKRLVYAGQLLEEKDFRNKADAAFEDLKRRLLTAGDEHGFDVEGESGKLEVIFEEPEEAKFVISSMLVVASAVVVCGGCPQYWGTFCSGRIHY
jgi:hypothetical protein